ncbi:MAG TPA: trigger factor [Candidatus Paceibacterota bacterium]|nr:trigger factor [Candidatus Paceibacterota bacterium]HRZ34264.1 trigger factor [Candidatus Paceibacterota bacterium]
MTGDKNYTIKKKAEANKELTIEVAIEKKFIDSLRDKTVRKLSKDIEIKGFRKGMAPEKMIVEKIGEMKIFEEQAYAALHEILPVIMLEEKIDALTSPKISVTKISPSDDFEFKATFTLMPTIELADYKKIAKGIKPAGAVAVTEKEVSDYIDYIRKNRAEAEFLKKKTSGEKVEESDKDKLPEFNDEFVKTLGKFSGVDDFKKQLAENMRAEREIHEKNRRRTEIIEKIILESKIDLPEVLIEEEKRRMIYQYRADVEKIGIKFEDYLKEIKKTEEDLKKEWQTDAVKRAKMNLILPKIAHIEKITPDSGRLEREMKHLVEHHKEIDENVARLYLSNVLTNEKVFEFLENI